MLRHHIGIQCGGIVTHLDLQIADGVTGVEWPEERNKSIHDRFPAIQFRKINPKFSPRRPEIEDAIFRKCRCQRIGVTVVQAECVPMQCVGNLVPITGQLR